MTKLNNNNFKFFNKQLVAKWKTVLTDLALVANWRRKIRNSETEQGEKVNALKKFSSVSCMLNAAIMY